MNMDLITKEVMEQYEIVRSSGICNMFDYSCVIRVASRLEFYALGSLTWDEYKELLLNFGKYMKYYGIKQ